MHMYNARRLFVKWPYKVWILGCVIYNMYEPVIAFNVVWGGCGDPVLVRRFISNACVKRDMGSRDCKID